MVEKVSSIRKEDLCIGDREIVQPSGESCVARRASGMGIGIKS